MQPCRIAGTLCLCTLLWGFSGTAVGISESARPLEELLRAVNARHPLNRLSTCGNWAPAYAALHRDILAGAAPQRYTIMRSKLDFGNGLADRLASSVTVLLYAILTNRAFIYDWDPPPAPPGTPAHEGCEERPHQKHRPKTQLWRALRSDFIDWRYRGPSEVEAEREDGAQHHVHANGEWVDDNLNLMEKRVVTFPKARNSTIAVDFNCDKSIHEFKALVTSKNLTALGEDYHTVVWYTDRAGVFLSFENPFLAPRLAAMGLKQETAFACLFDFIYRPTHEVLSMVKPELQVLIDPSIFKVGIQIRVGDWQLVSSRDYLFHPQRFPSLFHHYFQCAEELVSALASPGQRVVYYLLADVRELRAKLKARYGSRILTNASIKIEHIVKVDVHSDAPLLRAVGELWAFSLADHHILTRTSGFGKVGAMLSAASTRHIYSVHQPMNFFNLVALSNRKEVMLWRSRRCTPEHADLLSEVCTTFTGI